jgi:very-short-patch-repair endonuclease
MSERMSGKNNPMYGNPTFGHLGKHHSSETIKKLSGENNPMYGMTGEKNPFYGKRHTLETKRLIGIANSGENSPMFGRTGEKHPMFGKHLSLDHKKKISIASQTMWENPDFVKNMSKVHKELWKKPEHADKMWRAFCRRPNNQESECFGYINQTVPKLFKYVGNGKLNVDGRFPDFVSTDGSKLLIEFNGEHWHKGENTRVLARHYAKQGYRVLFIWSRELKNPERLKKKILKFVGEGDKVRGVAGFEEYLTEHPDFKKKVLA